MKEINEVINLFVFKNYKKKDILFVNAQGLESGSDIDIYCVIRNNNNSSVKIFEINGVWVEIFIDTWKDMETKISNADEICVSFITKMQNHYSSGNSYKEATKLIPSKFRIPEKRKNILYYRIKVLLSKYLSSKSKQEKKYFKGQIMPILFLLAFSKIQKWPPSPKKWITALNQSNNSFVKNVLLSIDNEKEFVNLAKLCEKKFKGIDIPNKINNSMTLLS